MDEQALRQIFSDFLADFERVLDDHVTEMRELMQPTAESDARSLIQQQTIEGIASDVGSILSTLEDRLA